MSRKLSLILVVIIVVVLWPGGQKVEAGLADGFSDPPVSARPESN